MDDLFKISETIIEDAKAALKAIKKKDYSAAIKLVHQICALSEGELKLILSKIMIGKDQILYFDIQKKAKEIIEKAKEAKAQLELGNLNETKKLLNLIIALEDNIIKTDRYYKNEVTLVKWLSGEAALLYYIRSQVDPYAQHLGKQIDILVYKLEHIDELLIARMQAVYSDAKVATKEFINSLFNQKIFSTEELQQQKQEFVVTDEKLYKKYTELTEHPKFIPHFDTKEPWAHIFSDAAYILILTVFGVVAIMNIKTYITKKLNARHVKQMIVVFTKQLETKTKSLQSVCMVLLNTIMGIDNRMSQLELKIRNLPQNPSQEQIGEVAKEYTDLKKEVLKVSEKGYTEISNISSEIGKEAAKLVNGGKIEPE